MFSEEQAKKLTDDLINGINEIKSRLNRVEIASDKREVELKKAATSGVPLNANGYCPNSPEEKAFSTYLKQGDQRMDVFERKTLVLANDAQLGYLAPDAYAEEVILKLQEFSPVRSVAGIRQTDSTAIKIPKQTGAVDAGWTSEIGLRVEDANLTLGLETIPTHEVYAFVKVGRQMLEDSRVNVDQFLAGEFGRKFANMEGAAFIAANVTTRPEGILTNGNVGSANSGNGTNMTSDGLIDLVYSLPQEYRRNGSWLMNRSSIQKIRKFKNNQNDYLWEPSFAAGQPERLLGYPIFECPDMPDEANAAFPVAFGDFRTGYLIVDRVAIEIQRLVERYAEYGIVAFIARKRVGGQVVQPDAIKKLRIAT